MGIVLPTPDERGGLNGSLQHLPKFLSQRSRRLISVAGVNSNKTKALFRFQLSLAAQIDSRWEVLSDQLVIWCCIDRLSWQGLSETAPPANTAMNVAACPRYATINTMFCEATFDQSPHRLDF